MSIDCAVSQVDATQASPVVLTRADFSKVVGFRRTRELVHSGRERLKTKLRLEFVDTLDAVATEVLQERIGEGWDGRHQAQLSRSSQRETDEHPILEVGRRGVNWTLEHRSTGMLSETLNVQPVA
jgi:hypothetical protein